VEGKRKRGLYDYIITKEAGKCGKRGTATVDSSDYLSFPFSLRRGGISPFIKSLPLFKRGVGIHTDRIFGYLCGIGERGRERERGREAIGDVDRETEQKSSSQCVFLTCRGEKEREDNVGRRR